MDWRQLYFNVSSISTSALFQRQLYFNVRSLAEGGGPVNSMLG
jgi:hypothetical protein